MTADAVGGVWTYALELARSLAAREVEVLLAVLGPAPSPRRRADAARIPGLRLEHAPFALKWMDSPWPDVRRAGDWLLELEATFGPDVVHLNGYALARRRFVAPRLVVAHSCVCSWHEAVHGAPAPRAWDEYRREVTAGLLEAEAIVAPTRWMLDAVHRHYGVGAQGTVIPNARSTRAFVAGPKEPLVFAAGRVWDEAKNLVALERAAPRLKWPVVIAGSPAPPGGPMRAFEHARLLGELEPVEVADWLSRAAIYALPAKYEPFGLSVLEAALSGCALVLGDLPSLRESWDGAALFVPPDSPGALAEALGQLIASPDLRDELAGRAAAKARRFSPEAQASAYLTQYDTLVDAEGGPACGS